MVLLRWGAIASFLIAALLLVFTIGTMMAKCDALGLREEGVDGGVVFVPKRAHVMISSGLIFFFTGLGCTLSGLYLLPMDNGLLIPAQNEADSRD